MVIFAHGTYVSVLCLAALVKKPAKKAKGGQSAKDALKAAAKQRRLEKQSAKPESPPWDNYNREGREVCSHSQLYLVSMQCDADLSPMQKTL